MSNLLILDLETTSGNVTPETEPIEVSFALIKEDENQVYFTYNMRPEKPVLPCSTVIHGLTQEDVDKYDAIGPVLLNVYNKMKSFDPETIVAAYNAQFDVQVLDQAMLKYLNKRFQPKRVLDILRLAQKLLDVKLIGNMRLDSVYYSLFPNKLKYLLSCRQTHSGSVDVELEEEVLMALWDKAEGVSGYTDCTLDQLFEYANRPMILTEWGWGKHRGESVKDVVNNDRSYVDWFMNKCEFRDQHPDLVYTIQQLWGQR